MTRSTWLRVSVATLRSLFTTRETVFIDTPASLATSSRVLGTRMQISVTALSTVPMAYDRVKQKVGAMRQDCAVRQVHRGAQRLQGPRVKRCRQRGDKGRCLANNHG